MQYFWESKGTIPDGVGFSLFDGVHFFWLGIFAAAIVLNTLLYKRLGSAGRDRWRKIVAGLIVLDELFKIVGLLAIGEYSAGYLPLHLCSINIFVICIYVFKPSKLLGNFLYTVCIPGAIAAILFPNWTKLPLANFMHIHSSTVHILLALFPLVLTASGELKPDYRDMPKSLGLMLLLAIPIYFVNLWLDTNFMFLMEADKGNPLYFFEQLWGNHLLGFPVLIAAIMIVMYLPLELYRKIRNKKLAAK